MEGRKILKWWLGGLGVALIVVYSFFTLNDFIRGPRIIISNPENGFSTTTPVIVVAGRGVHTNNLAINGAQTAVDLNGNFISQLILAPGYNIIEITAKDNYERIVKKTIEMVLVVPPEEIETTFATTTQEIQISSTTINQI
ncbi:MAG: hypothetical protein A2747_00045 [Candidatus Yonathbacteria bacterium RIFCSPHIGHO2_01_FULL_44_41]|uniref:Uncharacterized protein n=1 Tax=Candidatus Yonathbacteria bacterium RIFCSPHIGHO2_02_FULL_44_14 TaxID=1802724 RepID=A0A1G2S9E7_9BACT|nr:MAG: hypothetical protein A2747_00045 [Candidatus Yonathbacteria bacterium RIFCSPHIGHO2_01_FULL_44_41]OHA81140.1 MAG: hypothetical protein A3B06_00110 [Candidatus Yonathbacteria bacterium RIFCSPLOWO2_01_FULL_43_20]OHA81725.1 MAG: hypothetical protein A3D51_01390 [Candidatus Yonathbacteria bacterium RIFCSPHIGHO2_02_FULL_44_14]